MFSERINKLKSLGEKINIDAFFITSEPNIFYLTGFKPVAIERLEALILPVYGEPILIIPKLEEEKATMQSHIKEIRTYTDAEGPLKLLEEVLPELNLTRGTLGVEGSLPFKFYTLLKKAAPKLNVKDTSEAVSELRMIKSKYEIDLMRKAAEIVIRGIKSGVDALSVGKTELEVSFEIESTIKKSGGEHVAYNMVLSGENSALPHGITSSRKIKCGDAVVIDVSATYKGYFADITRTIFVKTCNQRQRKIYNTVLEAQTNAINEVKPGVRAKDVDLAARNTIKKAGYGKYFIHRTGHGLGIEVHEEPSIHAENNLILKPGMTFTIEPGIYLAGEFGVRIEDDVAVTSSGCKVLSSSLTKELIVV